jgi:hypothetical protein
MKNLLYSLLVLVCASLQLNAQGGILWEYPSEWEPNEEGKNVYFSCNPVHLGGYPLVGAEFIRSQEVLSVVECQQDKPAATKIPFRVYLRRNGKIIEMGQSSSTRQHFQIDLEEVLEQAENGDFLIINPVRRRDFQAKRIFKVVYGC